MNRKFVSAMFVAAVFFMSSLGQAGTIYQNTVKSYSGLQAYYTFDNVTSNDTTLADDSGNGHSGTFVSGKTVRTTTDTAGVGSGQALNFTNSSSAPVTGISETGFPSGNADRTMVLWTNTTNTSATNAYLCQLGTRGTGGAAVSLYLSSGQLYASQYGASINTIAAINDGNWHMIAVTVAATTTGNANWSIYLDGSSTAATIGAMATNTLLTYSYKAEIGAVEAGVSQPFLNGSIDEVAYYNRVLTTSEMGSLYSAMTIPEPSTMTLCVAGLIGLLAYAWKKRK